MARTRLICKAAVLLGASAEMQTPGDGKVRPLSIDVVLKTNSTEYWGICSGRMSGVRQRASGGFDFGQRGFCRDRDGRAGKHRADGSHGRPV
ncbi:hypothetical protein ACTQ56_06400 [[Clostridium] aminophilum]|uniref:hypothetical protein n=1 Tax=[Clostridium] aminophilum TaxID=1526 RepID=UPI003F946D3A